MIPEKTINYLKGISKNGSVVCLTGAGISAESGIPTFRGKGGIWEKYDPQIYANAEGLVSILQREPDKFIDFIKDFYSVLLNAQPNPAHFSLSVMEKEGILHGLITQNIDNLHQEAGNRNVIELHGNAFRIKCFGCQKTISIEKKRIKEMLELLEGARSSRINLLKVLSRYFPRCKCGSRYRIDIVLFGEMLAETSLAKSYEELNNCGTLLIIGSSLVVYPAAGLPLYAKERKVKLIEINSEPSALSKLCDYKIAGKASEVLPEILRILKISPN